MKRLAFLKNFSIMGGLVAYFDFLAMAQTKTEPEQTRFPPSPGPAIQVVFQDGTLRMVMLGPSITLLNQSGVYTLNSQAAAASVVAQKLTAEPDGLSWRVPVPYANPQVYRNGLRMLSGLDYVIEGGNIVRPTIPQGTRPSDVWIAS